MKKNKETKPGDNSRSTCKYSVTIKYLYGPLLRQLMKMGKQQKNFCKTIRSFSLTGVVYNLIPGVILTYNLSRPIVNLRVTNQMWGLVNLRPPHSHESVWFEIFRSV